MSKKTAKKATQPEAKKAPAPRDPKVITRSELAKLSDKEKQAFREANGTVIEDAAAQ